MSEAMAVNDLAPMSQLRVLFAPLGHFLSHRSRCLAVAEEMRDRGHVVACLCASGEEDFIRGRGLEAFAVHQMPRASILAFGAPQDYQRRFLGEDRPLPEAGSFGVAQMAADDLAVYEAFRPDAVVWDGRPTAPLTACLQGRVAIGINNLSMPVDEGEAAQAGTVQGRFQAELREVMLPRLQSSALHARWSRHLSWIVPGLPVTENAAKLALLGHPVHVHVGPLHWRGWDTLPGPAAAAPGRPRILVTLGSTFPFPQRALAIARALAQGGFDVVLNMDGLQDAEAEGGRAPLHTGVQVQPRLNLRRYLEGCVAVVHHGGHGSAMEALRAGVPALMLPFNGDQIDIARRVSGLGCGLTLPGYPGDAEGVQVQGAVRRLLSEPGFQTATARMRQELARWPEGAALAADFIERRVPQVRRLLA